MERLLLSELYNQSGSALPKIVLIAVGLVTFFVPFWQDANLITELSPGLMAAVYITALFSLVRQFKRDKWQIHSPGTVALLFVFCLISTLSIIWSVNPALSIDNTHRLWFYFLVFLLTTQTLNTNGIRQLVYILIVVAFIEAFYSIYLFFVTVESLSVNTYYNRAMGTFPGPNAFGLYMSMALLAVLGLVRNELSGKLNWHLLLPLPFILMAIVLSLSRGALIALLVGLVVFWAGTRERKIFYKAFLIIVLGSLLLGAVTYIAKTGIESPIGEDVEQVSMLDRYKVTANEVVTLNNRVVIWQAAIEMIKDRPIGGWGLGTFQRIYGSYQTSLAEYPNFAHNHYLQTLVETGVGGFISLLVFLAVLVVRVFNAFLVNAAANRSFLAGLAAACVAFLFHIAVDFDWDFFAITTTFFVLVGGTLVVLKDNNLKEADGVYIPVIVRVSLVGLLLVLSGLYYIDLTGAKITSNGAKELLAGNYLQGRDDFTLAQKVNPWEASNHLYLGITYLLEYQEKGNSALLEKTIEETTKAVARDSYNPYIYNRLGQLYLESGKIDQAESNFIKAIAHYKGEIKFYMDLGDFYYQHGQWKKAEQMFKEGMLLKDSRAALEGNFADEYVRGVIGLSKIYKENGETAAAKQLIKDARKFLPEHEALINFKL